MKRFSPLFLAFSTIAVLIPALPGEARTAPAPVAATASPATPAAAPKRAAGGFDTDKPVDVSSDHAELQSRADRVVLIGNVRIRQGDLGLDSERVTVAYTSASGAADPEIQRIDASGSVVFTRPGENAHSQFAIYDLNRRIITMLGGVVLTRGDSVVHGQRLVYDLASGHATVDGGSVGGTAPGTAPAAGGRVTGRFTVPKRSVPPAATSPAQ